MQLSKCAEAKLRLCVGVLIIMCDCRNLCGAPVNISTKHNLHSLCGAPVNISTKHNLHLFYVLMQRDDGLLTAETCIGWFYIKIYVMLNEYIYWFVI